MDGDRRSRARVAAWIGSAMLVAASGCGLLIDLGGDDPVPRDGGAPHEDATSPARDSGVRYGEPRHEARRVPEFTATSTEPVAIPGATLAFDAAPSEAWLVLVSGVLVADFEAEARLTIDGALRARIGGQSEMPRLPMPLFHAAHVPSEGGRHVVDMALRRGAVHDLRIFAFPLPPGADLHVTELETDTALTMTRTAHAALAIRPSAPGTYLLLAVASLSEAPGVDNATAELSIGEQLVPMPEFNNNRAPMRTFVVARTLPLDATGTDVRFWARTDHPAGATVAHLRILAFRTDVFAGAWSAESAAVETSTDPSRVVKAALDVPAADAPAIDVVIQSMYAGGSELPEGPFAVEFLGAGGSVVRFESAQAVGGPHFPYATATFGRGAALHVENAYVPQPEGTRAWESFIHALRLPPTLAP